MTTLFVHNPLARHGGDDHEPVIGKLRTLGPVKVVSTAQDCCHEEIRNAAGQYERIVVAGGDGTVNFLLPDLLAASLPVGLIPLGTANDLAHSLDLPSASEEAAEVVLQNHTRRVDVGIANDAMFVNAAGIGLGPKLNRQLDREEKRLLGVFAYLKGILKVTRAPPVCRGSLALDGTTIRTKFSQLTVASGVYYGGGNRVLRDAELDDGQLSIVLIKPQARWQMFLNSFLLRFGLAGRFEHEQLQSYRASRLRVSTRRQLDVSADGELVTQTPVDFRIRPRALLCFAPRTTTTGSDNEHY